MQEQLPYKASEYDITDEQLGDTNYIRISLGEGEQAAALLE